MFGTVVLGIPHEEFEDAIEALKIKKGKKFDVELDEVDMEILIHDFDDVYRKNSKKFPEDVREQLNMSIKAVFLSWNSEQGKSIQGNQRNRQQLRYCSKYCVNGFWKYGD
jgi:Pyruvate phosphate dikinase, PEP/pyruvate binding domain.